MDGKKLIWVDSEFAERWDKMTSEKTKEEERNKAFEEYFQKVSEASKNEFKETLEALEEDAAIYSGMMLKVKQSFGKAKDEALSASYVLWEKFEEEKPSVSKKVSELVELLSPLAKKLHEINTFLSSINTYSLDRVLESFRALTQLTGENREMVEFVIKNFKMEKQS